MFQVGDVVQLKSGGPVMTVTKVILNPREGAPGCRCTWFVDQRPTDAFFVFDALTKA